MVWGGAGSMQQVKTGKKPRHKILRGQPGERGKGLEGRSRVLLNGGGSLLVPRFRTIEFGPPPQNKPKSSKHVEVLGVARKRREEGRAIPRKRNMCRWGRIQRRKSRCEDQVKGDGGVPRMSVGQDRAKSGKPIRNRAAKPSRGPY